MFNPSRSQARRLFFDTWQKYHQKEQLSGMETIALEVVITRCCGMQIVILTRIFRPSWGKPILSCT